MWNVGYLPGRQKAFRFVTAALSLALLSFPLEAVEPEAEERAKLFIALLRRRAQRILEAHRAPPPPIFSASFWVSEGYESNVNLDGERNGDYFTEESVSLVFRPQLTSWLRGEFTANLLNTHFQELTDSNLWMNTFGGVVQFQPHRILRLDTGYEYGILNFPFDSDSSFFDQRLKAHLFIAYSSWLAHKIGWTYQFREYDTRRARDSAQNAIAGLSREDRRHTGSSELQFRFPKTFARIAGEYYENLSNDQAQEFYDWQDIRFRGVVNRILSPHWTGTLSASYERKNYSTRSVPALNVAERDNLYTVVGSVIYQVNDHASLSYSLTYRYQDSNDPRLDFTDWVNQVGVTLNF